MITPKGISCECGIRIELAPDKDGLKTYLWVGKDGVADFVDRLHDLRKLHRMCALLIKNRTRKRKP